MATWYLSKKISVYEGRNFQRVGLRPLAIYALGDWQWIYGFHPLGSLPRVLSAVHHFRQRWQRGEPAYLRGAYPRRATPNARGGRAAPRRSGAAYPVCGCKAGFEGVVEVVGVGWEGEGMMVSLLMAVVLSARYVESNGNGGGVPLLRATALATTSWCGGGPGAIIS